MNNGTDSIINFMMIVAMLIGFFQIRHLEFHEMEQGDHGEHEPEDNTMIMTAFGMFAYSTFTIIAGILNEHNVYEPGVLIVTNGIIELIEVGGIRTILLSM